MPALHLAAHAAACGELDALVSDPGFLLAADPGAVLAQRANLRTPDGKRALAAFDLSLHDWDAANPRGPPGPARLPTQPGCMPPRSLRHALSPGANGRFAGQRGPARDTEG